MLKVLRLTRFIRRATRAGSALLTSAVIIACVSLSGDAVAGTVSVQVYVPIPPASMPLYSLSITPVPSNAINARLRLQNLPSLQQEGRVLTSRYGTGNDALRAFGDPASGFTEIIPNMLDLTKYAGQKIITAAAATEAARNFLADKTVIPSDGTGIRLETPTLLKGSLARPAAGGTSGLRAETTLMALVAGHRLVGNYSVWGPGSNVVVSIDNNAAVVGFLRHWRTASIGDSQKTTISAATIRASIERQLAPATKEDGTSAVVDTIALGYYDADNRYLQPVYRFEASVTGPRGVNPYRIAGFVPLVATPPEAIPDLAVQPTGPTPGSDGSRNGPAAVPPSGNATKGWADTRATSIRVGQYINRDWRNDSGYTDMANAFMSRLQQGNAAVSGVAYNFTRTQYYEAWPWQIVGNFNLNRINAVNIAYTVPHGDWLLNTTLSNYGDLWRIIDIGAGGTPGLGGAAGGKLATWIIASCEVLPSFFDRANEVSTTGNGYRAFDAWWPVFKGLHNVIAYRTIMYYPNTALNNEFGYTSGLGGDVVGHWFQAITAHGNNGTYINSHLKNTLRSRYDRGSAMVDSRNLGQSIYSVNAQSAAGTLWNFWMTD